MLRLASEGVTLLEIKSGYGLELATEEKLLRVAAKLAAENAIDISPTLLAAHATPASIVTTRTATITPGLRDDDSAALAQKGVI